MAFDTTASDAAERAQMRCPICHQDNHCEIVRTGRTDVHCWCRDASMPVDLQRKAAALGTTCICRKCAVAV